MTRRQAAFERGFAMILGMAALAAVSARPAEARADVHLSAELAGALLVSEYARETTRWEADPGLATSVTAGWELRSRTFAFVPEVAFGGGVFADPYGRRLVSLAGGARAAWGREFRLVVALHAGWGFEGGRDADAVLEHRGIALDGSLGFEVPFDAHWSMAAQLSYRVLLASTGSGTTPEHWPGAGVSFALRP
jgi:hypothetical protein